MPKIDISIMDTPEQIKAIRLTTLPNEDEQKKRLKRKVQIPLTGLSQAEAAARVGAASYGVWQQWEANVRSVKHRKMSDTAKELFLLKRMK